MDREVNIHYNNFISNKERKEFEQLAVCVRWDV